MGLVHTTAVVQRLRTSQIGGMSQSAHDDDALQRVVKAFAAPYCRARIKTTSDILLKNIEQRCMADARSA
jgi:hypothetical protein